MKKGCAGGGWLSVVRGFWLLDGCGYAVVDLMAGDFRWVVAWQRVVIRWLCGAGDLAGYDLRWL